MILHDHKVLYQYCVLMENITQDDLVNPSGGQFIGIGPTPRKKKEFRSTRDMYPPGIPGPKFRIITPIPTGVDFGSPTISCGSGFRNIGPHGPWHVMLGLQTPVRIHIRRSSNIFQPSKLHIEPSFVVIMHGANTNLI